jgi:hypothetical protein
VLVIAFGFPKTFIFEALSRFHWLQSFLLGLLFPVLSDTKLAQWNAYVRSIRPPEALRFVGGSTGPRQKVPRHLGDCRLIFQVLIEVNCAGRKDEG